MRKPVLCLALVLSFAACSTKRNTPEQVALDFFDVLYNEHDIEKAEAFCTEESKENLRNTIRTIEGSLQIVDDEERQKYLYTIVPEQSDIKNDHALMTVRSSLDTTTLKLMLVKINDEWKVDFNYEEDVIDKGLIDEVLEIMEPFSDSITVEVDTANAGL